MSRINGDLFVTGTFSARGMAVPVGSVGDAQVSPGGPGNYVSAAKIQHQRAPMYAQAGAAVSETRTIYRCNGLTGVVQGFFAGSIVAAIGAATVTVDLRKNGASILTAVITLNNTDTARTSYSGTLTGGAVCAAGDEFEVVIVATAGGGTLPSGLFVQMVINEDPA